MRATTLQVLRLAVGILVVAALGGVEVDTSANRLEPAVPSALAAAGLSILPYVRITNATGGQVLPLGPSELVAAAPLMTASSGAETVFWATAPLASRSRTISVPVDGVTTRVAFVFSTDGGISDLTITIPRNDRDCCNSWCPDIRIRVRAQPHCRRPLDWRVDVPRERQRQVLVRRSCEKRARTGGCDVRADRRETGARGSLQIHGQPVAGRPTTLRTRVTREDITDLAFDLVSMSGAPLQPVDSSPVTTDPAEDE